MRWRCDRCAWLFVQFEGCTYELTDYVMALPDKIPSALHRTTRNADG